MQDYYSSGAAHVAGHRAGDVCGRTRAITARDHPPPDPATDASLTIAAAAGVEVG